MTPDPSGRPAQPLLSRSNLVRLGIGAALVLGIALAFALGPRRTRAQGTYLGLLDGLSVRPPNSSPGTGRVLVTGVGDLLDVEVTVAGLRGRVTAARLHCCVAPPGETGVAIDLAGFPAGAAAADYVDTFDLIDSATYAASFLAGHGGSATAAEAALLAGIDGGEAYLCVQSTAFPGCEVRAFLLPAPFHDGFESGDLSAWSRVVR